MEPRDGSSWTVVGLLTLGLVLGLDGVAAGADDRNDKKTRSGRQQTFEQVAAVASVSQETSEADSEKEQEEKKKKKKKKKKNKEGKKGQGEKKPAKAGDAGTGGAPAAAPPRVVRDVEKRLLAYDTSGARSLLASEPVASSTHLMVADGRVLEQEKKYGEAAARFQEAADRDAGDPAPLVYLGQSQIHAGNMAAADDAFRQAERRAQARLAADPQDAEALYHLGVAQQRLKRYDEAVATFEKLRPMSPSDATAAYQLGVTRAFQGNWQAAVDRLTEAIDMNPGIAYAYYYRGLAANELGRKDLLVNDLDRFVTMAPDAPEATQAKRLLEGL